MARDTPERVFSLVHHPSPQLGMAMSWVPQCPSRAGILLVFGQCPPRSPRDNLAGSCTLRLYTHRCSGGWCSFCCCWITEFNAPPPRPPHTVMGTQDEGRETGECLSPQVCVHAVPQTIKPAAHSQRIQTLAPPRGASPGYRLARWGPARLDKSRQQMLWAPGSPGWKSASGGWAGKSYAALVAIVATPGHH